MLSHQAAIAGLQPAVRAACRRQIPASSVALSRALSMYHRRGRTAGPLTSPAPPRFLTTTRQVPAHCPPSVLSPGPSSRWLSSHPICEQIDCTISKDLSQEEYDNAYKYIYHQHNHERGPWLQTLKAAEKVIQAHSPRILVIGSGPGEPAATLAASFPDSDVISAHSTTKCAEWASQRFHKHGLSNALARLVPSMENLDAFSDGSFDLVASCYGLAHVADPQAALNEIHRVLKPGGSLLAAVWENAPADPASDIILRHACVGPNPWHRDGNTDVVGGYACPVRSKHPMSLSKPHLLEGMLEEARLPVVEVSNQEYPLKLGKDKAFAFKALTLPIRSELQELKKVDHYHCQDAAEAFEDVLKEGFMVKMHDDGEMEVPYNSYKFVVARREFEDEDAAKQTKAIKTSPGTSSAKKAMEIHPIDVKADPAIFDTWNRMKSAASDKVVAAVKKQIDGFQHSTVVHILDAAPSPYATTAIEIASHHPYADVVATSKSVNVVEAIREETVKAGLSNMKVKALDSGHMTTMPDKSFDVIVCSFGLAFLSHPEETLREYRRLLKPGGSLIVSVWEDFSLKQLSDFIVDEMHAAGGLEDFLGGSSSGVLDQLTPYAQPRLIESLVTKGGFDVTHVDHEAARIILSDNKCSDYGVNVATLAIRPFLQELEKNGGHKDAFGQAKKAFDALIKDPSLVSHDTCGNLVTTLPSRFKIVTATRQYEDSDGYLEQKDAAPKSEGRTAIHVRDIPK
ncbi:hypothetical protein ACHAXT_007906 [Thalassiosira profunda]